VLHSIIGSTFIKMYPTFTTNLFPLLYPVWALFFLGVKFPPFRVLRSGASFTVTSVQKSCLEFPKYWLSVLLSNEIRKI